MRSLNALNELRTPRKKFKLSTMSDDFKETESRKNRMGVFYYGLERTIY